MTSQRFGRLIAKPSLPVLAALIPLAATHIFMSSSAKGATDTATLSVTANVQSSCAISGGSLDFGNYQSGQSGNSDAVGTISFTNCTGLLTFELDGGQSGNVNARAMKSGGNSLSYQLYRTQQRNSVFGTGSNAQQLDLQSQLTGTLDVFGRIPGNQDAAPGSYSDTVNITLTY